MSLSICSSVILQIGRDTARRLEGPARVPGFRSPGAAMCPLGRVLAPGRVVHTRPRVRHCPQFRHCVEALLEQSAVSDRQSAVAVAARGRLRGKADLAGGHSARARRRIDATPPRRAGVRQSTRASGAECVLNVTGSLGDSRERCASHAQRAPARRSVKPKASCTRPRLSTSHHLAAIRTEASCARRFWVRSVTGKAMTA